MNSKYARIVLAVSGLNEISSAFHHFPECPVGIIEITHRTRTKNKKRGSDCARYCAKQGFQYATVSRNNIHTVAEYLVQWRAELLITHSVPILPMRMIQGLKYGGVNLHHSLLPAYRGGNPLLWQVLHGEPDIGVSLHVLSEQVDAGDVLGQRSFKRPSAISKSALAVKANTEYGLKLLFDLIPAWVNGDMVAEPQRAEITHATANHFPLENLLPILAEHEASLQTLWDVANFIGYWPSQGLSSFFWQRWFRWVPESIQTCKATGCDADVLRPYQLKAAGIKLHLHHHTGYVVFRPQVHVQTVLAKLLL